MKLREKLLHLNSKSCLQIQNGEDKKNAGIPAEMWLTLKKKVNIILDIEQGHGYQMLEITFLSASQNPAETHSLG